jgi:hypothetical protein
VIVYVWLEPELTVVVPEGDIAPPVPADAVIVYPFFVKVAVAVLLLFIVRVHVELVPEHAPVHPLKVDPVEGVAQRLTVVPDAKLVPVGLEVTVPDPVPDVIVVRL